MGLASSLDDTSNAVQPHLPLEVDLTFDDIDDEELDSYIMTEHESQSKNAIWLKRNAAFLEEQKSKWCVIKIPPCIILYQNRIKRKHILSGGGGAKIASAIKSKPKCQCDFWLQANHSK